MTRRRRRILVRLLLATAAVLFALVLGELLCRYAWPTARVVEGREQPEWREHSDFAKTWFEADAEIGYVPKRGNEVYGPTGCKVNPYPPQKAEGVRRVLLIGDSVTYRARIERAIRAKFGESGIEYWNAGVDGYNTAQELAWFRRLSPEIRPDHVVLTLHVNDFEATPVVFHDEQDRMVLVVPSHAGVRIWPWLFEESALYRRLITILQSLHGTHDLEAGAQLVESSLTALRDEVAARHAEFTVLIFPGMAPKTEWSAYEKDALERARTICAKLAVRTFDLTPALEEALGKGLAVQETPGDHWHPNDAVSACFADLLAREGFRP